MVHWTWLLVALFGGAFFGIFVMRLNVFRTPPSSFSNRSIAKMEEKIASQEAKINELCSEKEINFDSIISGQDDLALMERRKKQFVKIINEMFPEE